MHAAHAQGGGVNDGAFVLHTLSLSHTHTHTHTRTPHTRRAVGSTTEPAVGGAIHMTEGGQLEAERCLFTGNTALGPDSEGGCLAVRVFDHGLTTG